MSTIRGTVCSVATVFALALIGEAPALGATHIWTGGANGLWSVSGNWNGGVPTTGEPGGTIVQFNANTTSSMNIAGLAVDQIHFAGSDNVISGTTGLTISGASLVQNIVSDADGNVLAGSLPLTLANATVEAVSNSGTLTVNGAIGGTPGLVTAGSGDVSLSGTAPNTYAGATTIISGTLHIGTSSGDVIAGSSLNIGDGLTPGARLLLENSSDISPQTPVIVNSDGVIDFQNHSDSAKSLTVNGGSVLGANLAVSNAVVMHDGTVTLASSGTLTAGSVNMIGGTISGPGPGVLALGGDLQATSSAAGPATISAPVRLGASPTITVAAGTAPELSVTGAISEIGGPRGITKSGIGDAVDRCRQHIQRHDDDLPGDADRQQHAGRPVLGRPERDPDRIRHPGPDERLRHDHPDRPWTAYRGAELLTDGQALRDPDLGRAGVDPVARRHRDGHDRPERDGRRDAPPRRDRRAAWLRRAADQQRRRRRDHRPIRQSRRPARRSPPPPASR